MTKEEYGKEQFEHLCCVIHSVFAAEDELRNKGMLTEEKCMQMSVEQYCELIAEEIISKTDEL